MKNLIFLFALLFCISFSGFAQKNIVTVPLAETVSKGKVYDQPGVLVNKNIVQLGNILTYGFGGNFQGGITIIDFTMNYGEGETFIPVDSVRPGMNPDVLVNLQKGFKLNNKTWIGIGTQSGANIADNGTDFSTFNYINAQTKIFGDNLILLGGYHGNDTRLVTEDENEFGILAGVQIPLVKKLTLLGDYISGNNARSYINTGLGLKLSNTWSMYGGAVIPAPNSGNKYGGTLQFRYLSK